MVLRIAAISLLFLTVACGSSNSDGQGTVEVNVGEEIYSNSCAVCHGPNGDLGVGGATDLSQTVLSRDSIISVVQKGRGGMPPQDHVVSNKSELEEIADYVLELKK